MYSPGYCPICDGVITVETMLTHRCDEKKLARRDAQMASDRPQGEYRRTFHDRLKEADIPEDGPTDPTEYKKITNQDPE